MKPGKSERAPIISRPFLREVGRDQLELDDVGRLLALWSVHDIELERLTLSQSLESVALDCRKVYKYIRTVWSLDESVTLGVVEPLYRASASHVLLSPLSLQDPRGLPRGEVPS